jgi:hypothetical protein
VCARIDNQQCHGVMITRVRSFCSDPSSSTSRASSIDLPLPFRRSRLNLSSSDIRFQVAREVLSCVFSCLVFTPNSTEKAKKYIFSCPITFRATIFVFSCFVEFVFLVVESCCWFRFLFSILSTPLHAFVCVAHLFPPHQQQTNTLHSLVCPTNRLVLISASQALVRMQTLF